jgi:two-component system cell cycle response regulator
MGSEGRTSTVPALGSSTRSAASAQVASLIVISSKSPATVGMMIRLDQPETVIGRGQVAAVQIEDDGISRSHAKVTVSPNGAFKLTDLGSTNGTFLNNVKVSVKALHDGDKIQIGANTVIKFSLQDPLEEAYQQALYDSATRDGLTGLFNKTYFLDALRKEVAYAVRHRAPLSLLLLDVDHFKGINDTYGHAAGDEVLRHIADRIRQAVRAEDLLARYGGEEFTLILREFTASQAMKCAERCREFVEGAALAVAGEPIRATISVGVSTLVDSGFTSPEELIAAADKSMYRAKEAGRNRVDAE